MNIDVKKVKIIVTIPSENLNDVRSAVCSEGAGVIGNYTYCTTFTKCIGTFIPTENANPYIGEQNKLEFVEEEVKRIGNLGFKEVFIIDVHEINYYMYFHLSCFPLLFFKFFNQF